MSLTSDPTDPRLTHGADPVDGPAVPQAPVYLVLTEAERAEGFVRPLRLSYWHAACGTVTTMAPPIAETYARQPAYYGATYCCGCQRHLPVGEAGDFHWVDPGVAPGPDRPKVGT